jgi:O-antigen ligase
MTTLYGWHTNTYTAVSAVCLVYAFGEYNRAVGTRRKRLQWVMLWSLAAVVVGTSSSSNVSAVLGLMAAAVLQRRYGLIALLASICLVAVLALLHIHGSLFEMVSWLFPGKSDYELRTLSGRTQIWGLYWESWLSRPILGHGFGVLTLENGTAMRLNSHNAFIASVLSCGIFGGLLATWFVGRLVLQSLRSLGSARPGAIGGAAALVAALVNSNSMPLFLEMWEESNLVSTALVAYLVYFVWHRGPTRTRAALLARR